MKRCIKKNQPLSKGMSVTTLKPVRAANWQKYWVDLSGTRNLALAQSNGKSAVISVT